MVTMAVLHKVNDYDAWRPVFDEHGEVRRQHGCTGERVLRTEGDDLNVLVLMDWPSTEAAHAFAADPSLPEAMARAGVAGPPRIEFYDSVADGVAG